MFAEFYKANGRDYLTFLEKMSLWRNIILRVDLLKKFVNVSKSYAIVCCFSEHGAEIYLETDFLRTYFRSFYSSENIDKNYCTY